MFGAVSSPFGSPSWDPVAEHDRLVGELGALCDLPEGMSAERCGRTWCAYYDVARGRCGLLEWDVPGRLGIEALRWFVAHRTVVLEPEAFEEIAAARFASL